MTEQEAKEKWCPCSRTVAGEQAESGLLVINNDPPAFNRIVLREGVECLHTSVLCMGSQCMMWRWSQEVGLCDGDVENAPGYCGLGGKP